MLRGRAVSGTESTLTISGSVSPATGEDIIRLPEGLRSNQTRVLFTDTALTVGGQSSSYEADAVLIDGMTWECQHVETWVDPRSGGSFYRCIVQEAST